MSCLFNSLGALLKKDPTHLRREVCDYLQSNPVLLDDIDANTVLTWASDLPAEQYIQRMRSPNTWGGGPELKAISDMFQSTISVHDTRSNPNKVITFFPSVGNPRRRPLHINYNGFHYDPVPSFSTSA
jgi:hypothetical protein